MRHPRTWHVKSLDKIWALEVILSIGMNYPLLKSRLYACVAVRVCPKNPSWRSLSEVHSYGRNDLSSADFNPAILGLGYCSNLERTGEPQQNVARHPS
jgi:hypothetical protein